MEERVVKRSLCDDTETNEKKVKISPDLSDENEKKEQDVVAGVAKKYTDVGGEIDKDLLPNSYYVEQAKRKAVPVEEKKNLHNDAEQHPIEEIDEHKHTLLDLNDDCLYKIFSELHMYDLTNIANTCVRFQNCAVYVFQHYRKCYINFDRRTEVPALKLMACLNLNEVREVIRVFGPKAKEIAVNMNIFNKLFSSDSALSKVDDYCKSLETITLNDLQFTKWFPQKFIYYDFDSSSDDDGYKDYDKYYDSDDDREWLVGFVSPKFLTNLPKAKNVIIHKGILFCGGRLFDNWKDKIDTVAIKDVLVGDGFLKSFRESYNEVHMIGHNENRRGRDNSERRNFRIVDALFTPKRQNDDTLKTQ